MTATSAPEPDRPVPTPRDLCEMRLTVADQILSERGRRSRKAALREAGNLLRTVLTLAITCGLKDHADRARHRLRTLGQL